MYRKILVALENSRADKSLLPHVTDLAQQLGSELLLVHVADGWVARNFDKLKLAESDEMKADRAYLEGLQRDLTSQGFKVETELARGDPATGLIKAATEHNADLIAMSTHGHRFISDVILGATADRVRHLHCLSVCPSCSHCHSEIVRVSSPVRRSCHRVVNPARRICANRRLF